LPLPRQPAVAESEVSLRESERASAEVLSLPMHPYQDVDLAREIADCLLATQDTE